VKRLTITLLSSAFILSGCISTKSYVDTSYASFDYDTLAKPTEPRPVRLATEFTTNGKANKAANKYLKKSLVADFEESGQFVVVEDSSAPLLTFAVNNVADTSDAVSKGFVTGLTFGASGSTVTDGYEAEVSLERAAGKIERNYKHGMVTTIGNETPPAGATEPMSIVEGLDAIFEDFLARFISEMDSGTSIASQGLQQTFLP